MKSPKFLTPPPPEKKKSKVSSNSVWISLCNVYMTMMMVVWRVQWSFIKNELVWCCGRGVRFYNLQNAFDDVLWRYGKLFGIQQPLHCIILNAGFILYINKNHVTHMLKLREGPLEKLWGGGRKTKKKSCKGKLSEKKFMHAE